MCRLNPSSLKKPALSKTDFTLPGTVWVASDIHLARQVPETCRVFYAFLTEAAAHANGLILAGDIFDAWIGDDAALNGPEPWLQEAIGHLAETAKKIPLFIGHGNRDFLMGPDLARALGATLMPDSTLFHTDAGPIHISHGDELCTHDVSFQRFRKLSRHPLIRRLFLALPLQVRRAIARRARKTSMHAHGTKPMYLMDVAHEAISDIFRDHPALIHMVHGHTHKPKCHQFEDYGTQRCRWVLPDWEWDHPPFRGGYLSISAAGITMHGYTAPDAGQTAQQ